MQKVKNLMLKAYCKITAAKEAVKNNLGDENTAKVIWIVIIFLVGAIALALITAAFQQDFSRWLWFTVVSWFPEAGELRP